MDRCSPCKGARHVPVLHRSRKLPGHRSADGHGRWFDCAGGRPGRRRLAGAHGTRFQLAQQPGRPERLHHRHTQRIADRPLGDYPLEALRFNQTSNLRVTSGLLLNQRFGPLGSADVDSRNAWPYLGLGLSGNGVRGDWGFQADFGLAAQSLGATMRLSRVLNGGLSVGDAVRDLRLQPVVRLGMNYSF